MDVNALDGSQVSFTFRWPSSFEQPRDAVVVPPAPMLNAVHFSLVQQPVWQTGSQTSPAFGVQLAIAWRSTHIAASASSEPASFAGPPSPASLMSGLTARSAAVSGTTEASP